MDRKVAIVGFRMMSAPDLATSRVRLVFELTRGLFDDLGIDRVDVDTTIIDSNDFLDGRTISNVFLGAPAGPYLRDESKVEMDGVNAVMYAAMRILSGQYRTAMVVSPGLTGSQVSPYLHIEYTLSPRYDRQVKLLNELSGAALQARAYLAKHGYSEELMDEVAAQALANAARDPFQARRISDVDKGKVAASNYYYEPLRELHCYPPTDGGVRHAPGLRGAGKGADRQAGVGPGHGTEHRERSTSASATLRSRPQPRGRPRGPTPWRA